MAISHAFLLDLEGMGVNIDNSPILSTQRGTNKSRFITETLIQYTIHEGLEIERVLISSFSFPSMDAIWEGESF